MYPIHINTDINFDMYNMDSKVKKITRHKLLRDRSLGFDLMLKIILKDLEKIYNKHKHKDIFISSDNKLNGRSKKNFEKQAKKTKKKYDQKNIKYKKNYKPQKRVKTRCRYNNFIK